MFLAGREMASAVLDPGVTRILHFAVRVHPAFHCVAEKDVVKILFLRTGKELLAAYLTEQLQTLSGEAGQELITSDLKRALGYFDILGNG